MKFFATCRRKLRLPLSSQLSYWRTKKTMRQTVHKQRELREKVVALNDFLGSMEKFPDASEHHAACLQDALRRRDLILMQLASLAAQKKAACPLLSRNRARRLLLLYAPSSPFAWALHWIFFFFLIAAMTGLIRILFHINYLRPSILIPLVIGDFVVVFLARLASFYVDRPKLRKQVPDLSTVGHCLLRRGGIFLAQIVGAQIDSIST
jgi:hypothetical protein